MAEAIFEVFRGDREGGKPATYRVPIAPGMVVLDALHHIRRTRRPIWRCAGIAKPGSAAPVRRRSTVDPGSPARLAWTRFPWTNPLQFSR